jgi:nucleoside-diphosphate-sugar epimerase
VLYWGDADRKLAFTTKDDTAAFTARATLDEEAPRILRIAGSRVSPAELAEIATRVYGKKMKLFRAGGVAGLERLIRITRALTPETGAIYPPWQGMQYLHNMYSGYGDLSPLDNDRYGRREWASAEDVLRGA